MGINNIERAKAYREKREQNTSALSSNVSRAKQYKLRQSGSLDTLWSDFDSTNNLINDTYSSWQDAKTLDASKQKVLDMKSRLSDYSDAFGIDFDDNQRKTIQDAIASYDTVLGSWDDTAALYGYYKTADAFNAAMEKQKNAKAVPTVYESKYAKNAKNADYADRAKYVAGLSANDEKALNNKVYSSKYEYINTGDWKPSVVGSMAGFDGEQKDRIDHMTDEEKQMYNYIYATQGGYAADVYLNDIANDLSKRSYDEASERLKQWQDNHGLIGNALASAGATLGQLALSANPYGTTSNTTAEMVRSMYDPNYSPYAGVSGAYNFASEVNSNITERLANATDSKVLNEALKIGGNAATMFLPNRWGQRAFGPAYNVIMGTGAYLNKYKESLEQGLDQETAVYKASAAGLIEFLTEQIGMEWAIKGSGNTALKTILKQARAEGMEEVVGNAANILSDLIYDKATGKEVADYQRTYQEYVDRGFTPLEALGKTVGDNVLETVEAYLSAALSAGVEGGGHELGVANTGSQVDREAFEKAMRNMNENSAQYEDYLSMLQKYNQNLSEASNWEIGDAFNKAKATATEDYLKSGYGSDEETAAYKTLIGLNSSLTNTSKIETAAKKIFKGKRVGEATQDSNGNSVKIANVEIDGEDVKIVTDGAEVINREEMTLSQADNDLVENAKDIPSDEVRKAYIQNYNGQDIKKYDSAVRLVLQYGKMGLGLEDVKTAVSANILTDTQIKEFYSLGQGINLFESERAKKVNSEIIEKYKGTFTGGTFDDSAIKNMRLSTEQRNLVGLAQGFAHLGINIKVIYDPNSTVNGHFSATKDSITFNLAARHKRGAAIDNRYVISTMAHEFTHWMEDKLGDEFNFLKAAVRNTLGEEQWNRQLADELRPLLARKDKDDKTDYNAIAESEVIARACEDMLNSEEARDRLLSYGDADSWSKIKKAFMKWFNEVKAFFKDLMDGYGSDARAAAIIRENEKAFNDIQKMWLDMFERAVTISQARAEEAKAIENQDKKNNIVTEDTVVLSEQTYENGGKEFMENFLRHQVATGQLDQADADDIMLQMEKMYQLSKEFSMNPNYADYAEWQKTGALTDKEEKIITAIVSNGDYDFNIDFATVCKKRKALDKVLSELVKQGIFDESVPNEECITEIIAKIKEHGFEVACGLCFVDAKRYRVGRWATNYLEGFYEDEEKKTGKYNIGYNEMVRKMAKLEGVGFVQFDFLKRDLNNLKKKNANTIDKLTLDDNSPSIKYLKEIIRTNKAGTNNHTKAKALLERPELRKILAPAEIISSVGFDALRVENPYLFDMVKASSGSNTPKLSLTEVAFTNEVAKDFLKLNPEKQENLRDSLRKVGGYRLQSFSDYMGNMVLDYVQLFSNFSACRFNAHSYTKEYAYVMLFGMTGMKINMSVVPDSVTAELKERFKDVPTEKRLFRAQKWNYLRADYLYYKAHAGLAECSKEEANYQDKDDDGNIHYWKYITVDESFPLDKAMEIQKDARYNKNCGIIWVGVSDAHILALLRDSNVPMVIPYHKSGINPVVAHMRGIAMYNDYTDFQNARIKKINDNGKESIVKLTKDSDPKRYAILKSFNFYDALDEAEAEWNAKSKAEQKKRSIPQMAADKYLKMCRENDIIPIFDQFATEDNYYKLLEDFRLYDGEGNYAKQQAVTMTFPENFNELVKDSLDETAATSRDMAEKQSALLKDAKAIVRKHSKEMDSVQLDSEGAVLTEGQAEYFKDSKIRDDNGNLIKVYHGSDEYGFTVFDTLSPTEYGSHFGTKAAAARFDESGEKTYEGYLNITNPIRMPDIFGSVFKLSDYVNTIHGRRDQLIDGKLLNGVTREPIKITNTKQQLPINEAFEEYSQAAQDLAYDDYGDEILVAELAQAYLKSLGFDGVIYENAFEDKGNDSYIIFDSEQFKRADNLNPTKDRDMRYSEQVDSDGTSLTEGQAAYFKNSKVRDDDGNLKVMYHGSRSAGFTIFQRMYSDDNRSFFFTDKKSIAYGYNSTNEEYIPDKHYSYEELASMISGYTNGEQYLEKNGNKIILNYYEEESYEEKQREYDSLDAVRDDFIDYINRFRGVSAPATYKVYLNATNPLVIDADFNNWDEITPGEFSKEYRQLHIVRDGDTYSIEYDDEDWNHHEETLTAKEFDKRFGYGNGVSVGMGQEEDYEWLYVDKYGDVIPTNTREYSAFAKAHGYDSVIFNNIVDTGIYAPDFNEASQVVVVFDANQIKSVANENPTENDDIRYSKQIWDDTENEGDVRYYKFKKVLSIKEREEISEQISDEVREHIRRGISLDFSGVCFTMKHIVFYESYDDINPEIIGTRTWKEMIRHAVRSVWISAYINEIALKSGIFGKSDREGIVKLAEAVGVRGYASVLHRKAKDGRRDSGESEGYRSEQIDGYTEVTPGKLGLTDERIDKLLGGGWYGSTNPDYAQAYIAYMSPDDFLKLTTGKNQRALERIKTWGNGDFEQTEFDFQKMADKYDYQPIQLNIDEEANEVVGHEGRHRMWQLKQMGYNKIPVLLFNSANKYDKKRMDSISLMPQWFQALDDDLNDSDKVTVKDLIPFSQGNRELIKEKFGSGSGARLFSEQIDNDLAETLGIGEREAKIDEAVRDDILALAKILNLDGKTVKGVTLDQAYIKKVAKFFIDRVGSKYSQKQLEEDLTNVYAKMLRMDANAIKWDAVMGEAYSIAEDLMSKANIKEGDWFKKVVGSQTNLSVEDKEDYQELANYLQQFTSSEQKKALAIEIYNKLWYMPTINTAAQAKKQLLENHRKMMNNVRLKAERDQKLADDFHYQKIIHQIREQKNAKYAEFVEYQKKRNAERKDMAQRAALVGKITDTSMTLMDWMNKNSKKEHVPEALKPLVKEFVGAIDYSSRRALGQVGGSKAGIPTQKDKSLRRAIDKIYKMVLNSNTEEGMTELETFVHFPDAYKERLAELSTDVNTIAAKLGEDNEYVLNEMTVEQLESLYEAVRLLKTVVTSLNKAIAGAYNYTIASTAQEDIQYHKELGSKKNKAAVLEFLRKFFKWDSALPIYAFDYLGPGAQKMFTEVQDGWDKFSFNVKKVIAFAEESFTPEQRKAWSEEIKDFEVLVLPTEAEEKKGGKAHKESIQMTTAQVMSLYCLSKREHAKAHFAGGGIRVATIKNKGKEIVQTKNVRLSEEALEDIIGSLTKEQIAVADKLQEFMNTVCSDWGNEVTMKLYGIKGYTEKNYFPIKVDSNILPTDNRDNEKSIYALLNMSFTKPIKPHANNQMEIGDIFDVFTIHTSEMAKYNSIALPVLDMVKWYSYKEKDQDGNVTALKGSIEQTFGKDAKSYIMHFLNDLNGNQESGRGDSYLKKLTRAYKTSAVAANLQVAALQPISIFRATAVMDGKYLFMGANPAKIKRGMQKAAKYSGIANWKSMSLFDTNVSRGLDAKIKRDDNWYDKTIEASMKLAEMADEVTWGALWNACEYEVAATSKLEGEAFYEAVNKRFRDVIYRTQVVDSTMTRTDLMRSSSLATQWVTSFMSEPSVGLNVLTNAVVKFNQDSARFGSGEALKRNGKIIRMAAVGYSLSALAEGVLRGLAAKWRDWDDDDTTVLQKMWQEFWSNMNIFNNIPVVKDVISIFKGYNVNRMDVSWAQSAYYAFTSIQKNGITYKSVYRIIQAISGVSGVPLANAMREVKTLWNNTIGNFYPDLKFKD